VEDRTIRPTSLSRFFFSASDKRLRTGWRLLIQSTVLFFFIILVSPCLFFFVEFGHNTGQDLTLLVNTLGTALPVTVSVYLARTRLDRRPFSSLGLRLNNQATRDFLFGFGLPALLLGLIFLFEWAVGWLHVEAFAWQTQTPILILQGVFIAIIVFLLTGWGEELLFRGYWLQNLAEGLNWFWAVIISSIVFALAHSFNPDFTWEAILGLVVAGVFFAFGYMRTSLLWLPIGFHFGWNFFEGTVLGFQVSGLTSFSLIQQTVNGPPTITGGAFGPEAGLIVLPALGLGAVLIYLYTRKRNKI
jgi:uncharacterized protein